MIYYHAFEYILLGWFCVLFPVDFRTRHWHSFTERSGPPERKPQVGLGEPWAALSAGADQQRLTKTQGTHYSNQEVVVPSFDINNDCKACWRNTYRKWKKRTILQQNLSALKRDPATSQQHVLNQCTTCSIFFTALLLLLFSQVAKNIMPSTCLQAYIC